jgi:hypothetical protein
LLPLPPPPAVPRLHYPPPHLLRDPRAPCYAPPAAASLSPLQQAKGEIAGLPDDVTATNAEVMKEELLHHQVLPVLPLILPVLLL